MCENLISVNNASLTLHADGLHVQVLKNINFYLKQGEHVAILGPNGSGKSTFLRMLAGEVWIEQNNGSITWHYDGKKEHSPIIARYMTALVSPAQQEQYTRHEWQLQGKDILFTAFNFQNISESMQCKKVEEIAHKLNCTNLLNMNVSALSQGQLKLLLLTKAILQKAKVLLLDEYLDGLDNAICANIIQSLKEIAKNTSLIICTHREQNLKPLMPLISKKLYMQNGELSTKQQLFEIKETCSKPKQAICNTSTARPIIALSKATVFVDRVPVLHNINWQLHHGEHWSIKGRNGAGKSTFLRLIAGDEFPAIGGSIKRYFSRLYPTEINVTRLEHIRHAISLVSDFEQASYAYNLNGLDFVLSGIDNTTGTYRQFNAKEVENAKQLLQNLGLSLLQERYIRSLSTGQLRFLCIARALMLKPEVILLDEPFSGLDMQTRHKCLNILENLSSELSIIIVSHHSDDHLSIINREAIMENGYLKA